MTNTNRGSLRIGYHY